MYVVQQTRSMYGKTLHTISYDIRDLQVYAVPFCKGVAYKIIIHLGRVTKIRVKESLALE